MKGEFIRKGVWIQSRRFLNLTVSGPVLRQVVENRELPGIVESDKGLERAAYPVPESITEPAIDTKYIDLGGP